MLQPRLQDRFPDVTAPSQRGAEIGRQRHQRAYRYHHDPNPDPGHERVKKDFDDWQAAIRILSGIDYVQVPGQSGVICNHGGWLLRSGVEALFRSKLGYLLVAAIDVEQ